MALLGRVYVLRGDVRAGPWGCGRNRQLLSLALAGISWVGIACGSAGRARGPGAGDPAGPAVEAPALGGAACCGEAECLAGCDSGDAAACHRLAGLVGTVRTWVPESLPRALETACEAGYLADCAEWVDVLTHRYRLGEAIDAARRGCDAGSRRSCVLVGYRIVNDGEEARQCAANPRACGGEEGAGRAADAARLWREACEGGDGAACARFGTAMLHAGPRRPERDRIIEALRAPCRSGTVLACLELGEALSVTLPRVETDFMRSSCETRGGEYCRQLEQSMDPETLERADHAYRLACRAGDAHGCLRLGEVLLAAGRTGEAEEALAGACGMGDAANRGAACGALGLLLDAAGRAEEGIAPYERACAAGDAAACWGLAALYGSLEAARDAEVALGGACRGGYLEGCAALGSALVEQGRFAESVDAWTPGCSLCEPGACFGLGRALVATGRVAEAESPLGVACDSRLAPACMALGDLLDDAGRAGDAEGAYRRGCDFRTPQVRCPEMADFLDRQGRHDEAESWRTVHDEPFGFPVGPRP